MREHIKIELEGIILDADLTNPEGADSLVIFSHGSGSSRFSPRNNFVAQQFNRRGIATCLLDLLTREEDADYHNHFDIKLLSERLVIATKYLQDEHECRYLPMGFFGSSTGAASALVASAVLQDQIKAIVCRGGRVDLADDHLYDIHCPTLLIAGELDPDIIKMNKEAFRKLSGKSELAIIPSAGHLFEEPGALERVAQISGEWFQQHLSSVESTHNKMLNHET